MANPEFMYSHLFGTNAPKPAARWTGFPRFNFVGGHNDPTQIPIEALLEAAGTALRRDGARLALYNTAYGPLGFPALRDFLATKLGERRGIACTRDDLLITSGSGQAIDLVSRILLEPGDTVILEEFSYSGAISKLRGMGVDVVGAPLDQDGLRMDALASILEDLKQRKITPKFIYTIPTVQNPTGSILPLDRRLGLLALAKDYGVPIFEDECYADLIWSGEAPPALYGLDPAQVIHIGSFSKSLAPALRLGYVLAGPAVLDRLVACKSDGGTGALEQMVVAEYFTRSFGSHVEALTAVLQAKLDTMLDALAQEFGSSIEVHRPKGGIFVWVKFPDTLDVRHLIAPAADAGLSFNPGPEWSCLPERAASHLRLCFALPSADDIREGVATLARVCFEQTGIPVRSANMQNVSAREPA